MNKYQALVNGVYGDGWEIAEFSAEPSHDGDTLAQYVARELSDSEECHSVDDAIQRIGTAMDELEAVHSALLKAKAGGVK